MTSKPIYTSDEMPKRVDALDAVIRKRDSHHYNYTSDDDVDSDSLIPHRLGEDE